MLVPANRFPVEKPYKDNEISEKFIEQGAKCLNKNDK